MKDSYVEGRILLNEEIAPGVFLMELAGDFKGEPGQFYMLRAWKSMAPFLPRPLSISNLEEGKISFLYQVVGIGTEIMSDLKDGDELSLLGPLGNGFPPIKNERVALVAGGIGIAPLLYLARKLSGQVDLYAGFRDRPFYLYPFEEGVGKINLSTETGSVGHKGFITEILDPSKYDRIIACGPTPMLEALTNRVEDRSKLILSLESRMACGIGACVGCTIETREGKKRVCKDGPVFSGEEVVFHA